MDGLQKMFLSWVFCAVFALLPIHGFRVSITWPTSQQKRYESVVPRPSQLSTYAHHPPQKDPPLVRSPEFHSSASSPSYHLGPAFAPLHPRLVMHKNKKRYHAHPPYIHGPSVSPISAPSPAPTPTSTVSAPSPAPTPTSTVPYTQVPVYPPMHAPSGFSSKRPTAPWLHPVKTLPPPPPNLDCNSLLCTAPLTNTPPGAPCSCVLPMKVGIQVNVALYAFFPLVSELAQEIAVGVLMEQSQVRIMGANAANGDPEKTVVLINLVPRGEKFDNNTARLTYEKFWHKKISIKESFFGSYDVLYVLYPGLPSSPPSTPAQVFAYGNNPMIIHPFAVEVNKPKGQHSRSSVLIIVLSSIITLVLCIGVALALFLRNRNHVHQALPIPQTSLHPFVKPSGAGFTRFGSRLSSRSVSMSSSIATHIGSVKTFSLSEIERATNKFDNSRIIGEGGFGLVYEGTLEEGTRVAVKVLKRDDQQGVREFLAEVEMLSRLHHRNLVKLLGICTEEYIHCLVYELIRNGSVESHLYGTDRETAPLDWNSRMKIALGAARCLAYLHEDSNPHVIHRDFKSSNILLEHDFTPKLCDFGLARTALGEENEHISTRVMGTFGYVAPEYAMTGHLLVKSDVYSYGVVLLELLTGRKPVDIMRPSGQENLVTWARPLLTSKEGLEAIVDPSLGTTFPFDGLAKVAAIASMCVQPEVSQRPFIGEVVQALKLVCSESSCGQRDLSCLDIEATINSGIDLDESEEVEMVLSTSDLFSMSTRFTKDESGSTFRRHSSSGPLRDGKNRHFWHWVRGFSGGSVSEHEIREKRLEGSIQFIST